VSAAVSGGNDNASGRLSVSYQRYGGWYDGKGNEVIIDNTQTGLQYSDRIDVMGTGTINIDDRQQLQLTTAVLQERVRRQAWAVSREELLGGNGRCDRVQQR
jgi:outer membrane receptor protein involved in Fe transport